jgi:hypothetical protein
VKRALPLLLLAACAVTDDAELSRRSEPLWSTGPRMGARRALHRSVRLDDGRILIIGGASEISSSDLKALPSAEIYDPATNLFRTAASMGTARVLHTATLLDDGRVLVVGGAAALDGGTSSAEVYDPRADSWTPVTPAKSTHAGHTAHLLPDGRVLVIGGFFTAGVEAWDPRTDTWQDWQDLPRPPGGSADDAARGGHATVRLDDGRYFVSGGGRDWTTSTRTTAILDPTARTWTLSTPMSTARVAHTATLLRDGRVLLAGGTDGGVIFGAAIATAEIFAPVDARITPAAPMGMPRFFHGDGRLESGRVVVIGGDPDTILGVGDNDTAEAFDPTAGAWAPAGKMSVGRTAASTIGLGPGRFLISGGFGGVVLETSEILTLLPTGSACRSRSACESGACSDGVCCATACRGACEACDASGTCRPVDKPAPGHPTCDAYGCFEGACRTTCSNDEECVAGAICVERPLADSVERPLADSVERPLADSVERPLAGSVERPLAGSVERPLAGSVDRACIPDNRPKCSADRRASVAPNGVASRCGAYLCEEIGRIGRCRTDCRGSGDCAVGYACDRSAARCLPIETAITPGACAYGQPARSRGWWSTLLVALIARARRRLGITSGRS